MNDSSNKLSQKDILRAIEDWVISLSELSSAIRDKLDKTLVWDVPLESISMIEEFKELPWEKEIKKFQKVEGYLKDIVNLRNESDKPTLKESNWKTYLVLWQDDIFEVIEHRWPIYIAYNPIKERYIVYKFLWEDSDQNTSLLVDIYSIEKTNIEWYYKVEFCEKMEPIRFQDKFTLEIFEISVWNEINIIGKWYYFIWENWETQDFWYFRKVWDLNRHWNTVFFNWALRNSRIYTVIHNWDIVREIPIWYGHTRKSESWRHLLHFLHNFPWNNSTNSLFDLDNMRFIFERANRFIFNISFPENDVWTFENKISWEFHKKRQWLARLLWKKVIKHSTTL